MTITLPDSNRPPTLLDLALVAAMWEPLPDGSVTIEFEWSWARGISVQRCDGGRGTYVRLNQGRIEFPTTDSSAW